jgi:very-short-patch-repair endonuclease
VSVEGVPTFRLDLAYPRARVAIEYDGEEFHSSPEDKQADRDRRAWLERHGWVVIVVDKDSFTDEALGAWIEDVRRALTEAHRPPVRRFVRS